MALREMTQEEAVGYVLDLCLHNPEAKQQMFGDSPIWSEQEVLETSYADALLDRDGNILTTGDVVIIYNDGPYTIGSVVGPTESGDVMVGVVDVGGEDTGIKGAQVRPVRSEQVVKMQ